MNSAISFSLHKCTHILPFLTVTAQRITGISLKLTHFLTFCIKEKRHKHCFLSHSLELFFSSAFDISDLWFFHDSGSIFSLVSGTVLLPSKHKVVIVTHTHFRLLGKRCRLKCMFGMTFHLNQVPLILRSCPISDLIRFLFCWFSVTFCNTYQFSVICGFQ